MPTIECPNCHKKYSLPSDKIGRQTSLKLKCKSCGHSFILDVSGEANKKYKKNVVANDEIASGVGDATMFSVQFSKEGDTSPYFFPEDCEIFLTYKVGDNEIKKIINKRITIFGRTEGDVIINDKLISRKHAGIEVKNSTMVELKDLASKNGTFHNDMKITSVFLQTGDIIRIGSTIIHYSCRIKF